jgi:16S rRNA (uracil1498-N3)-methyltransferase
MLDPMFYCAEFTGLGDTITLQGPEARHVAGSRRLKVGDGICLFDGRGTVGRATIENIDRRAKTIVAKVEECQAVPAPTPSIELACALPKGERLAILLDMTTQLGMAAFRPLECERSVVTSGPTVRARWQRICAEACKQSRRPHLPTIHSPATLAQVLADTNGCDIWVADPTGVKIAAVKAQQRASDRLLLMVGPEGGFSENELSHLLRAGGQMINLGDSILRIETAAVVLLSYAVSYGQSQKATAAMIPSTTLPPKKKQ